MILAIIFITQLKIIYKFFFPLFQSPNPLFFFCDIFIINKNIMKHLLNNLTEEEKNSIRGQHTEVIKVVTENFSRLINAKSGDAKPLINEQQTTPLTNNSKFKQKIQSLGDASNWINWFITGDPQIKSDEGFNVDSIVDQINLGVTALNQTSKGDPNMFSAILKDLPMIWKRLDFEDQNVILVKSYNKYQKSFFDSLLTISGNKSDNPYAKKTSMFTDEIVNELFFDSYNKAKKFCSSTTNIKNYSLCKKVNHLS